MIYLGIGMLFGVAWLFLLAYTFQLVKEDPEIELPGLFDWELLYGREEAPEDKDVYSARMISQVLKLIFVALIGFWALTVAWPVLVTIIGVFTYLSIKHDKLFKDKDEEV